MANIEDNFRVSERNAQLADLAYKLVNRPCRTRTLEEIERAKERTNYLNDLAYKMTQSESEPTS